MDAKTELLLQALVMCGALVLAGGVEVVLLAAKQREALLRVLMRVIGAGCGLCGLEGVIWAGLVLVGVLH